MFPPLEAPADLLVQVFAEFAFLVKLPDEFRLIRKHPFQVNSLSAIQVFVVSFLVHAVRQCDKSRKREFVTAAVVWWGGELKSET